MEPSKLTVTMMLIFASSIFPMYLIPSNLITTSYKHAVYNQAPLSGADTTFNSITLTHYDYSPPLKNQLKSWRVGLNLVKPDDDSPWRKSWGYHLLRSTTKKNAMHFDCGSQREDSKHPVMQLSSQMVVDPKEENFHEPVWITKKTNTLKIYIGNVGTVHSNYSNYTVNA